jgi:predicted SprT family Zn-dependent metalloprotease
MKLVSLDSFFGWEIYYMKRFTYDGTLYAHKKGITLEVKNKNLNEAVELIHTKIIYYELFHSK